MRQCYHFHLNHWLHGGWTIKAYCDIGTAGTECEVFDFVVFQAANLEKNLIEMMIGDEEERHQRLK